MKINQRSAFIHSNEISEMLVCCSIIFKRSRVGGEYSLVVPSHGMGLTPWGRDREGVKLDNKVAMLIQPAAKCRDGFCQTSSLGTNSLGLKSIKYMRITFCNRFSTENAFKRAVLLLHHLWIQMELQIIIILKQFSQTLYWSYIVWHKHMLDCLKRKTTTKKHFNTIWCRSSKFHLWNVKLNIQQCKGLKCGEHFKKCSNA